MSLNNSYYEKDNDRAEGSCIFHKSRGKNTCERSLDPAMESLPLLCVYLIHELSMLLCEKNYIIMAH